MQGAGGSTEISAVSIPWRSLKVFAFALVLFLAGTYFIGIGYILYTFGSMNGGALWFLRAIMMVAGLAIGINEMRQ